MIPRRVCTLVTVWSLLALAGAARSGSEPPACPEPPSGVPRGLFIRSALGPAVWFGSVGRDSKPGLAFSFGAGWEFFSWLAVEAAWTAGFHDTDQPRPPAPGSYTTHAFHGGLRFGLPLGRFDLFLRGGAGVQWSRPDILVRIERFDAQSRFSWLGGLGFTWHTPRRHFWIGLQADAMGALDFPGVLVTVSGAVGCTLF